MKLQQPRVPVWSNVDAHPHTNPEEIRDLLVRQVLQPVLWEQTIRNLLADGVDQFYEIGPGRVLAGPDGCIAVDTRMRVAPLARSATAKRW